MSDLNRWLVTVAILASGVAGCAHTPRQQDTNEWVDLTFVVDGVINLRIWVPPAETLPDPRATNFVVTYMDKAATLLFGFYDPGRGRNTDLHLTRISATIVRFDISSESDEQLSLERIKSEWYQAERMEKYRYRYPGIRSVRNREWLEVVRVQSWNEGVNFICVLADRYALILSVTVLGDNAKESRLYEYRLETLRKMLEQIDIEVVGENPIAATGPG